MLLAHGVDCQQFQHLLGTIFQHQLFTEIVDCYEKVARITSEYGCKNSSFVPHIIEFTKMSFQAVEAKVFPIALQFNDLANLLAETSLSICKGIVGSAYDFVDMYVLHPVETAQQFATLLGGVMKFVGDAMVSADSEGIGWSHYVESLEKEHSYDARYAQEVINQFKDWCEHSSAQEKIQATSKVITDCIFHPKLLSMVGGACCSLISEIPEIKFLKGFSDISAEYQLATEFGEVGLHSMQDVTKSLIESEVKVVGGKTAQSISDKVSKEFTNQEKLIKSTRNKQIFRRKGASGIVCNANGREGLVNKIESLLSGQKKAAKIRELPDGRIRYYKAEKLSKTSGPTKGSSYVTEYDLNRGIVRSWQESYDQLGKVNRVHPKTINGNDVVAQHYPPIRKEIEFWDKLKD